MHSPADLARFALRAKLEQDRRPARWAADPVLFASEAFGVTLWDRQAQVVARVATHSRVAVKSGHKSGKSLGAAVLAYWWAITRTQGRVVMTSASSRQVRSILWREIKALRRKAKIALPEVPEMPDHGIQWPDGREIVGFSTDHPERMAGISGSEVLFILDEASGIAEPIFEAIEGNRAGGARIVMFSNPTQTSGTFFDAFNSKREFWQTIHISSEETPNVVSGRVLVPGLATREWVQEKRLEWGEDSPLYQVRVRGDFPSQADNSVIPLSLVESAGLRWEDTLAEGRLELGVDVARFGDDDSAIAVRRGKKILEIATRSGFDEPAVAGLVLDIARRHRIKGEQKPLVKVDSCGVGLGVLSILKQSDDIEVIGVSAADPADAEEEFPNLRSQLWFSLSQWLAEGGAIPEDARLETEMVAPKYGFDARGRRVVEKKEDFKRRLGRSPDRADAAALAVYTPPIARIRAPREARPTYRFGSAARGF